MPASDLKCCCGRQDCAYLEHNTIALEGLEKDVEIAGRLGQVLGTPHIWTPSVCQHSADIQPAMVDQTLAVNHVAMS